jgi:hypothetical protein
MRRERRLLAEKREERTFANPVDIYGVDEFRECDASRAIAGGGLF